MSERPSTNLRTRALALALCTIAALASGIGAAAAESCPGNPNALGTSRTLVVDPREHPRIGTMQYSETLPLQDHEVVLTFDDGPLPKYSNQVLDILAKDCVKATFFVIGRMAQSFPEGVRKLRDAGHTIGTHSQNHPLSFNRMSEAQAKQEVDQGIASTLAALNGDKAALSPFFRIPGLLRAGAVEDYLASQGVQAWSADFPADDWRHISSDQVFKLAMSRLEAKGKGILLLHDIQPRTVGALPRILAALKAGGYRIVHVVPATPEQPRTPTEPGQWKLHPISEEVALSHWPKVPNFAYADSSALPGPGLEDLGVDTERLMPVSSPTGRRLARGAVPTPMPAPWPRKIPADTADNRLALPVPAETLFSIPEREQAPIRAMVPLHAADRAEGGLSPATADTQGRKLSLDMSAAARPISGSVGIAPEGLQHGPAVIPARPRPLNH